MAVDVSRACLLMFSIAVATNRLTAAELKTENFDRDPGWDSYRNRSATGPGNGDFAAVQSDGTRYTWQLDYDPVANNGNGRIDFVVNGAGQKKQPWEGKPITLDVPADVRKAGGTFDHFGLLNGLKPG